MRTPVKVYLFLLRIENRKSWIFRRVRFLILPDITRPQLRNVSVVTVFDSHRPSQNYRIAIEIYDERH